MKKLFYAALAVLMLACFAGLAGCTPSAGGDSTTEPESTAAPEAGVLLTEGGAARYTVIRPDSATDAVIELAKKVRDELEELTGADVTLSNDFLRPDTKHDSETYEILVGATNYDETARIMSGLTYYDYAVAEVGHKIVLTAQTEAGITKAVNYFVSRLLPEAEKNADGNFTLPVGEYIYRSTYQVTSLAVNGKPISDYRIVYGNADKLCADAAQTLSEVIASACGVLLPVVTDREAEAPCEILVGSTNRREATSDCMSYRIFNDGDRIVIDCGGGKSGAAAARAFYVNALAAGGDINITSSLDASGTLYTDPELPLTDGADLRIISFNILTEVWGGTDTAGRAEVFGGMLEFYRPDVVGVQEVCSQWRKYLPYFIGDYKLIGTVRPDGGQSYSAIIYDSAKYEIKAQGVETYSYHASAECRNMSWAVLTDRVSGTTFAFVSTHWDFGNETEKVAMRTVQANELSAKVKSLAAQYNCPVFTTGDYNCSESSTSYAYFMSVNDMYCAKFAAAKSYNTIGSTHTVGSDQISAGSIDFIFGTKNTSVMGYKTLTGNGVLDISDHNPVLADIRLPVK